MWNNYKEAQELYERTGRGNSPNPPIKPTITLPWGKVHTIAKEIDPIHIKDEVIVKFREEYAKSQSVIDEYNSIKNMSYKELKKHVEITLKESGCEDFLFAIDINNPDIVVATEVYKDYKAHQDHFKNEQWVHFSALMAKYPHRSLETKKASLLEKPFD